MHGVVYNLPLKQGKGEEEDQSFETLALLGCRVTKLILKQGLPKIRYVLHPLCTLPRYTYSFPQTPIHTLRKHYSLCWDPTNFIPLTRMWVVVSLGSQEIAYVQNMEHFTKPPRA